MKKRFWTRMISTVLTMAMAFSILVMLASAANGNSWAVGVKDTDEADAMIVWLPEAWFRERLSTGNDALSGNDLENAIKLMKDQLETQSKLDDNSYFYEGDLPSGAYLGLSKSDSDTIYWYPKEVSDKIEETKEDPSINWDTGELEFSDGDTVSAIKPAPSATKPSAGNSSAGGSSDGSGVAIVAVVGAVAAATGVYFYTHPEKVEEIKAFFADLAANVQAKVQQLTSGVKGVIIPDREEEEAEQKVEAVNAAEAQAA